jgi:hypothetical protein
MKSLTAFILAILMLSGIFVSCEKEPASTITDPVTDPITDPTTEPETEPDTTVRIEETPLAEYTVVYGEGYETAAKELAARLGAVFGGELAIKPETEAKVEHELAIFAPTRGASAEGLGMDDFRITEQDGSLNIVGGSVYATETACAKLIDVFTPDKYKYSLDDCCISYTLPDRREYINDISKLALHWDLYFDTPEWMLNFDEKYAAARDPGGRLMSSAHRGDMVYYPENSVEGIISAIMMGCDMVEIDPRLTKDGVFVLLHDATLTRTTDCVAKAGKNGLPRSANVADWTYEQLLQLNLKMGKGGTAAELTPYKIPTLDEVMKVCAGHILVQLDVKGPSGSDLPFWDFEKDIWPLLEKYEMYPQVIFTWHDWLKENKYNLVITHLKKTKALTNKRNIVIYGDQGNATANDRMTKQYGFNPCIRLFLSFTNTEYKDYLSKNQSKLDSYKGKFRTYANVTTPKYESQAFYAELYDAGITFQLVDKAFDLCTYIADTFEPTPYK